MTYQGLGPVQSIVIFLILVVLAFFPWVIRKALEHDEKRRKEQEAIRQARKLPVIMSGRQAAGRHLYGEAYQWSDGAMHNYDHTPELREMWELAAERKRSRA